MVDKHYYLDANAHVPKGLGLSKKSKRILADIENSYIAHGHPLSPNKLGRAASAAIETARDRIAKYLNVSSHEIHFTRSCTEANALVCKLLVTATWSPYEHHSMDAALSKKFVSVATVPIDKFGQPKFEGETVNTVFVGVQPEIGLIADFKEIRQNTRCFVVSDLAQAAGKLHLDLPALGIDVATFGAHKFGGPLGVGFIYANDPEFIEHEMSGYAQDVPGTLSVVDIVEASLALQDSISSIDIKKEKCLKFRDTLEGGLEGVGCKIICKGQNRIYNTSFIRIPGDDNGILLLKKLADKNIHVGLGSACGSFVIQESAVMQALGVNDSNTSYIRISQNGDYDDKDAEIVLSYIYKALKEMGVKV